MNCIGNLNCQADKGLAVWNQGVMLVPAAHFLLAQLRLLSAFRQQHLQTTQHHEQQQGSVSTVALPSYSGLPADLLESHPL